MKAVLLVVGLVFAVAGCTEDNREGNNQTVSDTDLATSHVVIDCPFKMHGKDGFYFEVPTCTFKLEPGPLDASSIRCIDTKHIGGPDYNIESSVTITYWTPGNEKKAARYQLVVESSDSATGSCFVDGKTDGFGKYQAEFRASCFSDGNNYWPGVQAKADDCPKPYIHAAELDRRGDLFH